MTGRRAHAAPHKINAQYQRLHKMHLQAELRGVPGPGTAVIPLLSSFRKTSQPSSFGSCTSLLSLRLSLLIWSGSLCQGAGRLKADKTGLVISDPLGIDSKVLARDYHPFREAKL